MAEEIRIDRSQAQQRMDRFLCKYLSASSKGNIHRLLRKKIIRRNGAKADPSDRINQGDIVTIRLAPEVITHLRRSNARPENRSPLSILSEDTEILAVSKPAGQLVHPDQPQDSSALTAQINWYLRDCITQTFAPAPINRLDRNTGGIILIGKTYPALKQLNEAMRTGKIRKWYCAVAEGINLPEKGEVRGRQIKDHRNNRVRLVSPDGSDGRVVHTRYRVLHQKEGLSFCEVELLTGRSHQIRAAFASLGAPLVGDLKYGGHRHGAIRSQLLHCWRMEAAGRIWEDTQNPVTKFWKNNTARD
ncbi:MAG: RluA family pseudouridine synthase [Fibrobacterota bacterium]